MLISAGLLNERITILKPSRQLSGGVYSELYVPFRLAWARVSPLRASDKAAAQLELSAEVLNVWTRYIPGMRSTFKILWRGRRYDILTIENRKPEGYLLISAELDNSITQEAET